MSFLKSIFGKKEIKTTSYEEFWNWFQQNATNFHKIVKEGKNIEDGFFTPLSNKLNDLKKGAFWYLAGMLDEETVELILTADGNLLHIAFVEDLVAAAPNIPNWKITCLKQPSKNIMGIKMNNFTFDETTLSFYDTTHKYMPDLIDITIVFKDYNEDDKVAITNGIYLLLDNYLGELNAVTSIDRLQILKPEDAEKETIPLKKLKDFLIWREKEFIEKYKGFRHDTENDMYSALNGELENGLPTFAIMNTSILEWDSKASHPWIAIMIFKFNGEENNGMPDSKDYELLNTIEDEITALLKDSDGYINIGRETADSVREIYFACHDFRKPSRVFNDIKKKYESKFTVDFEIYKDKYWQTFNKYI